MASIAESTTAHPNEMSDNATFCPKRYVYLYVYCFIELLTLLYVISVYVTCQEHSIVFHTWSDKLWATIYHILLVCKAQSALKMYLFLKADTTVSIFMIIMYRPTYLVSLTLFLCIYFTCIFIHLHSPRCHVLYTIELKLLFWLHSIYYIRTK